MTRGVKSQRRDLRYPRGKGLLPPLLPDTFEEDRNLQQVPRRKLKTVDGKISPVGWHFYALLNSDVKFTPVPSVERVAGSERTGLNEVRSNEIQRRFGKSRK